MWKLFGPDAVLFMSNDDKARIPLGLAAANLQAPILMHMEYKVKLIDHDFVVGPQHKSIPSVYGICEVTKLRAISYSGNTFIRVRSGNHDTSNAYAHAYDVRELFQGELVKRKPILLMEIDGAQDEAPRYPKTLATAVDLFCHLNLDVLLHGVNAAGLSAFNPVERRMAPLSHDLAGLVLPHDHYGSHLDSCGKTIGIELEKMNFYKAAEVLSEVWSQTVIDGYPVECNAVPIGKEYIPPNPDPVWVSNHCLQSRYCLQIVKCRDIACCSPFETNWLTVFNNRLIPFPAIYKYAKHGMDTVEPSVYFQSPNNRLNFALLFECLSWKRYPAESAKYEVAPFDLYCPSMNCKLDKGICKTCNQYWPSEAAMLRHKKSPKKEIPRRNQRRKIR